MQNHTEPSRRFRRGAVAALAGTFAAFAAVAPASAYDASVTRTTGGIAHIKAATIGDGAFGVGYAAAQDSICTLADEYLNTSGERSKFLGAGTGNANLNQDYFWKSIIDDRVIEKQLDRSFPDGPSTDARKMARGYAAGFNKYLAEQGGAAGISDPRCSGKDYVRPITEMDEWRLGLSQAMRASSNTNISGLVAAAPPAALPRGARAGEAPPLTADEIADNLAGTMFDPRAEPTLGSNAIGLGKDSTRSGNGMVLGNPHFPWAGGDRFWEFQLTVPGEVDVVGAALMGSPAVNIGHNRHVAWSHTVSTGRRFTFHKLALLAGDPTSYVIDGDTYKMRKQTVTVQVKNLSDGTLSPATHDWYFTRFGRVSNYPAAGLGWNATTAYAYDDANGDNLRLFDQWLDMDKARSAQGIIDSQKRIQGIPWVNTLGADDRGTSFFTDQSVAPNLTSAQIASNCIPASGQPLLPLRLYVLDGSRKACDLGTDDDAVRPGIFGGSKLPVLKNTTYVQNSNDSHWQTNPDTPLTGYSPIIGNEFGEQGLRTRLGVDIIKQRLAGTDGLSSLPKFTLDTLKSSWTQTRNLGAELTLPGLRQLCHDNEGTPINTGGTGGVNVNVSAACPVLDAFDGTGKRDSAGGWLFARWFAQAPNTSAAFWSVPFDPNNVLTTPNTLNQTNTSTKQALAKAVKELQDKRIPLNATWGDVQHATRGSEIIPLGGCNTGCYPVTSVSTSSTSYGEVGSGSSFVMFAEMDPVTGPKAKALLSYSQSEDPTSPYYKDQTERFSDNNFIDLPYSADEIAAAKLVSADVSDGAPPENQGPAGPTGPGGTDGTDGQNGAAGPAGPAGSIGPIGPQGTPGVQGAPGPQGAKGSQGSKGSKGSRGPRGYTAKITAVGKVRKGKRRVVARVWVGDKPVSGRTIVLKVGGRYWYKARTDKKGYARFTKVTRRGSVRISSVR